MKEGGKLRERIFSELHEIALDEARRIHREKVEHAAVIDAAGNVTRCTGDADGVAIPDRLYPAARIIVHNHPHEFKVASSFSGEDVYNLFQFQLDEIIVCGYGYYFYMRRGEAVVRALDVSAALKRLYRSVEKNTRKRLIEISTENSGDLRTRYREYQIETLEAYHQEILVYAAEKKISYGKEML